MKKYTVKLHVKVPTVLLPTRAQKVTVHAAIKVREVTSMADKMAPVVSPWQRKLFIL